MARTANQKKIIKTANKVRTITDTQYMMQLHFLLRQSKAGIQEYAHTRIEAVQPNYHRPPRPHRWLYD